MYTLINTERERDIYIYIYGAYIYIYIYIYIYTHMMIDALRFQELLPALMVSRLRRGVLHIVFKHM